MIISVKSLSNHLIMDLADHQESFWNHGYLNALLI
jgi:hypothetical protein